VSLPGDPTFAALPTTIFEVMSVLALRHGAVNLGQGFPDSEGPEDVREVAARAFRDGPNQYPPMLGVPALRQAIADHYRRHQALDVTADQVMVTSGATQALAAAILGLVGPGDEVAMFQPLYDTYAPMVRRAGGVVRPVRLDPPDWRLTPQALDAAIGPSTKLVIFNNPLNPAAVVYDEDQLRALAMACIRHDVIAICDEVWEHIVFDGRRHTPLMGLPGMADRTVKIGSAGKIFSLTGWKVGWTIAPPPLAAQLAKAHQNLQFTVAPGLQLATAYGLGKDMGYFDAMRRDFARSRDRLAAGLKAAGFVTTPSQGTYFLNIDLAASGIDVDDATFCLRAAKEAGVVAIPVSALYEFDPVTTIVRLCFAKRDETLDGGVERLAKARALVLREGVSCGEAGLG
jgi:N-succinyldiaminopimelate aminotransferase